jgi:hypothetical protein
MPGVPKNLSQLPNLGLDFKARIGAIGDRRKSLLDEREAVTSLAVGSSHGDYGFDPQFHPGSFNLCTTSQDLKYSHLLYEKSAQLCPKLREVILFYSIFSPGSVLEKIPAEKNWAAAINEVFHLELRFDDPQLAEAAGAIKGQLDEVAFAGCPRGFSRENRWFFPEDYGARRRANDHLKLNRRTTSLPHLIRILSLAKLLRHRMVVVIPPVRSDYRNATGTDPDILFADLLGAVASFKSEYDVTILNFHDSDQFADDTFGDYDHLLPLGRGTKILSTAIARSAAGAGSP